MAHDDFDALFRDLYVPAYRVALRMLRDRQEAEDAASEALARTAAAWTRVRGLEHQRAWVLRVTANVAIDILRKRRPAQEGDAARGPDGPRDADDRVVLAAALRRLPRRQREVLVLRFLADMTEAEVAAHLQITRGAVKVHANRGLDRLRQLVAAPMEEVSLAY